MLASIHQNPDSSDESSDSDEIDELSGASIREQEEKYGESIVDYHRDSFTNDMPEEVNQDANAS